MKAITSKFHTWTNDVPTISLYVALSMLLMLKMLWFYRDKLSWNESYCHKLFAKDTGDSFNWLYLLSASQHNDWVFLLLLEMQQKLMICRIVCSKCWADYHISVHPSSSGANWSWWVVMAAHQVLLISWCRWWFATIASNSHKVMIALIAVLGNKIVVTVLNGVVPAMKVQT
jgi:hypothetical protein